jgi:L-ascorbate metabolism protein UlaG (beta-lactamase superfamily)
MNMLRGFVVVIVLAAALAVNAQPPARDTIPTASGDITIVPVAHASLEILHGNAVILVDPALDGALPRPPAPPNAPPPPPPPPAPPGAVRTARYNGLTKPTLVLVTHLHEDHFGKEALAFVRTPATTVVGPPALRADSPGAITMANGTKKVVAGIGIEAVPMYNVRRGPKPNQVFHPKGEGNGYILTIAGKRLYIAGDTECTSEMKALKNIDVAFLPMNLPFTMTPVEAAECAAAFRPAVVYPYHYAGQDTRLFESSLAGRGIDLRRRNWYPVIPLPN